MSIRSEVRHALISCRVKRRFDEWEEAEIAALRLSEDLRDGRADDWGKGAVVHAYRCMFGPHWHVGHRTKRQGALWRACVRMAELYACRVEELPERYPLGEFGTPVRLDF